MDGMLFWTAVGGAAAAAGVVVPLAVSARQSWRATQVQTLEFCSRELGPHLNEARAWLAKAADHPAGSVERHSALAALAARPVRGAQVHAFFRACNRIGMAVKAPLLRKKTVMDVWPQEWFRQQWNLFLAWMEVLEKPVREDTYPGFRLLAGNPPIPPRPEARTAPASADPSLNPSAA